MGVFSVFIAFVGVTVSYLVHRHTAKKDDPSHAHASMLTVELFKEPSGLDANCFTPCAKICNASSQPVLAIDVICAGHLVAQLDGGLQPRERVAVALGPTGDVNRYSGGGLDLVVIEFTTPGGVRWRRNPDGGLQRRAPRAQWLDTYLALARTRAPRWGREMIPNPRLQERDEDEHPPRLQHMHSDRYPLSLGSLADGLYRSMWSPRRYLCLLAAVVLAALAAWWTFPHP